MLPILKIIPVVGIILGEGYVTNMYSGIISGSIIQWLLGNVTNDPDDKANFLYGPVNWDEIMYSPVPDDKANFLYSPVPDDKALMKVPDDKANFLYSPVNWDGIMYSPVPDDKALMKVPDDKAFMKVLKFQPIKQENWDGIMWNKMILYKNWKACSSREKTLKPDLDTCKTRRYVLEKKFKQGIEKFKQGIKSLENEKNDLQNDLNACNTTQGQLQTQLTDSKRQIETLAELQRDQKNEQLAQYNFFSWGTTELQKQKDQIKTDLDTCETRGDALEKNLHDLQNDLNACNTTQGNLQTQLNDSQKWIYGLEDQSRQNLQEIEKLGREKGDFEQQINVLKDEKSTLSLELRRLEEEREDLENIHADEKRQIMQEMRYGVYKGVLGGALLSLGAVGLGYYVYKKMSETKVSPGAGDMKNPVMGQKVKNGRKLGQALDKKGQPTAQKKITIMPLS